MNTPSHAIVNYALLNGLAPRQGWGIAIGAILPDLPMLVLVLWARVKGIPGQQLWGEVYWQSFWQDFTHYFHSIPLAMGLAIVAHYAGVPWLKWLCLSMVLHSIGDLPLHHDDAHRHFLPLSQYRFISPVSYWDRNHHAVWGALAENLAVLGSTIYLWNGLPFSWIKGLLGFWNAIAWIAYCFFFLGRVWMK
jgi:hypothetical protein